MAESSKKQNFFARSGSKVRKFFRDMKSELKKVVYPDGKQVFNNTLVVILCVIVVGVFVWVVDLLGGLGFNGIISLVK